MLELTRDALATMQLTFNYQGPDARHTDHYYCGSVNLWRDCFTAGQLENMLGMQTGESRDILDEVLLPHDPSRVVEVHPRQWQPPRQQTYQPVPRPGRWYPQGLLHGVSNIYSETVLPMRVTAVDSSRIVADCNHPLAGRRVRVTARALEISNQLKERGGRCADWLDEALADGPGIQVMPVEKRLAYAEPAAMARRVEEQDSGFYRTARLVNHVDEQAMNHLHDYMSQCVQPEMEVLDLMSSWQSHLPPGPVITGLGLNEEELRANRLLTFRDVQDLNAQPTLPYDDAAFDLVCCHLSFEYLVDPDAIVREIKRVLRPGGRCVVSFSNRWFPEKVTHIWTLLHDFERMRYVITRLSEVFEQIATTTYRNWPRPEDDKYYGSLFLSDPLYVVSARK